MAPESDEALRDRIATLVEAALELCDRLGEHTIACHLQLGLDRLRGPEPFDEATLERVIDTLH